MANKYKAEIEEFMAGVKAKNGHETEFLQAVEEVAEAIIPFMDENPKYKGINLLERMVEPERTIIFRVPWLDDKGNVQVNRGFRVELQRHIGANTDVPAGDIGVGGREIGFLFGQYKKIRNEFVGILTGKGANWGGSLIRPEATGYGTVYFAEEMFKANGDSIHGKTVAVSGSGNVAQYAIEKILHLGGKVVTASDSSGYIYVPKGIHTEKLDFLKDLKNNRRGRIKEMADKFEGIEFFPGERAWNVPCDVDVALPCATQNELNGEDAAKLMDKGLKLVAEGANMPSTPEAIEIFHNAKITFAPGKASNAGGVATSGLEMSQNSLRLSWTAEEVDGKLHNIMKSIHAACVEYGTNKDGYTDYVKGANIAGFVKVADSMIDQGLV